MKQNESFFLNLLLLIYTIINLGKSLVLRLFNAAFKQVITLKRTKYTNITA